jgi:hypothetical protein
MVVAITVSIGIGLWLVAEAMLHRAQARTAADAIALAAVVDQSEAESLARWYEGQGVVVEQLGSSTMVRSGPSQAASQASVGESTLATAPALRAIVARAEQLLGVTFPEVQWHPLSVSVPLAWAGDLALVADELGMCERPHSEVAPQGWVEFALCHSTASAD